MWTWKSWVLVFLALAYSTYQISTFFVHYFSYNKCWNLPRSFNCSIWLFKTKNKLILFFFHNFKSKSLCYIPFCTIVSILWIQIFYMIKPYRISENLFMFLRNHLKLTCKFEFFLINLENSFENFTYSAISFPDCRLQKSFYLFISLANTYSSSEIS